MVDKKKYIMVVDTLEMEFWIQWLPDRLSPYKIIYENDDLRKRLLNLIIQKKIINSKSTTQDLISNRENSL